MTTGRINQITVFQSAQVRHTTPDSRPFHTRQANVKVARANRIAPVDTALGALFFAVGFPKCSVNCLLFGKKIQEF